MTGIFWFGAFSVRRFFCGNSSSFYGWESQDWSAWRSGSSRETHCSLTVLKGCPLKRGRVIFTEADNDRTRGGGLKLKEESFRFSIKKKFFPVIVVEHWHSLLREVVASPLLELFKASWVVLRATCPWQGIGITRFLMSLLHKPFYNSMIAHLWG